MSELGAVYVLIGETVVYAVVTLLIPPTMYSKGFGRRYMFFISFPLVLSATIVTILGTHYLLLFIASSIVGPIAEYAFGRYFLTITGTRLWQYEQFSFGGHTSLLIVPAWGFAGVLFVLLSRLIS